MEKMLVAFHLCRTVRPEEFTFSIAILSGAGITKKPWGVRKGVRQQFLTLTHFLIRAASRVSTEVFLSRFVDCPLLDNNPKTL
ncbi:MAG TPA: hypothetical protein VK673_17405 [Chthoniobacterales bacterium]|nr:hypothetical protein [Chthoniobacterales bacterium]